MVNPTPGAESGGSVPPEDASAPAPYPPYANGSADGAPSFSSFSTPPPHVPGRADGPSMPPEWPRPLDAPFGLDNDKDEPIAEGGELEGMGGIRTWYADPLDDPANWGPPLPPEPAPQRSVWELLWPWGARGVVETVEVLALALLMFLFVRSIGQNFVVDGGSMEPTFHNGEMLIVNKLVYRSFNLSWLPGQSGQSEWRPFGQPEPRDVVVFRFPQDPRRDFIKRVIALPGETIEVHAGQVYVNGVARTEAYLDKPPAYEYGPVQVPEGQYFVLGDNRNNSYDSHSWGMLGESFMIGRAEVRYWPLAKAGRVDNEAEIAATPQAGVLKSQ